VGAQPAQAELRDLYAASYGRLVGVVGAVCGDRHEAEEAVQEAFIRLLRHWDKVARYDNPEALGAARRAQAGQQPPPQGAERAEGVAATVFSDD